MTSRDTLAFTYLAEENPEQLSLPGVPLRDLTMRDFARHPEHVRAAIVESLCYSASADFRAAWAGYVPNVEDGEIPKTADEQDADTTNTQGSTPVITGTTQLTTEHELPFDAQPVDDSAAGEAAHVPPAVEEAGTRTTKKAKTHETK